MSHEALVIGVVLFVLILWGIRGEGELSIWEELLYRQAYKDHIFRQRQMRKYLKKVDEQNKRR